MAESKSILKEIIANTRRELKAREKLVSISELKRRSRAMSPLAFVRTLISRAPFGVIAEIKKASPSRGIIRENIDPVACARSFVMGGATCLSVLTDKKYFQGSLEIMSAIRAAAPIIPILRKDFILSSYQIWETKAAGADALLLIVAALEQDELIALLQETIDCELAVLIEVHNEEELALAISAINNAPKADYQIALGINNRDLATFTVDLDVTKRLSAYIKDRYPDIIETKKLPLVSESGIQSGSDIKKLQAVGATAFLVGESLLAEGEPADNLSRLLKECGAPRGR